MAILDLGLCKELLALADYCAASRVFWEGRVFIVVLAFAPKKQGNTLGSCRAATETTACKEDLRHYMVLDLSG